MSKATMAAMCEIIPSGFFSTLSELSWAENSKINGSGHVSAAPGILRIDLFFSFWEPDIFMSGKLVLKRGLHDR